MPDHDVRAEIAGWRVFKVYVVTFRLFLLGFGCIGLLLLVTSLLPIGIVKAAVLTIFPLMVVDLAVFLVSAMVLKRKIGPQVEDPFGMGAWLMRSVFWRRPRT